MKSVNIFLFNVMNMLLKVYLFCICIKSFLLLHQKLENEFKITTQKSSQDYFKQGIEIKL